MSKTNPARGMRDFLPADIRKREYVIGIIKQVYESYGFEPLETPAVENLETLTGKYGEEGNQLMFKILKRGEKLDVSNDEKGLSDLALRYDLTVPLARVVANYKNELPKFFKRYQIQPVWRADRPARGRYREFFQCDVDAVGSKSMIVEAELISAVSEILQRLGFVDFEIRINHRKLLVDILNAAGVPEDKHTDALVALDKLDKIGREGVEKEFLQRGVNPSAAEKLLVFFESLIKSDFKQVLGKTPTQKLIALQKQLARKEKLISERKSLVGELSKSTFKLRNAVENLIKKLDEKDSNARVIKTVATQAYEKAKHVEELVEGEGNLIRLKILAEFLLSNHIDESEGFLELWKLLDLSKLVSVSNRVVVDPSLARGLSYYTGTIMEIVLTQGNFAGSLGGGGRYDGLIGMFGKEEIPACGFSLGLERILLVMDERGMFPENLQQNSADVMVTIWNEETIGESLELANKLRQQGLRVLVYPNTDKLIKQLKYADSLGITSVAIIGEDERKENLVKVKDMIARQEQKVSPPENEKKYEELEREIFLEFVAFSKLDISVKSIANEKYPKPDISCLIDNEKSYFEIKTVKKKQMLIGMLKHSISLSYFTPDGSCNLLLCYDNEELLESEIYNRFSKETFELINYFPQWKSIWFYERQDKRVKRIF